MELAVITGVCAFAAMALIAVLVAIRSAVSTTSGFERPDERDE